MVESLCAFDGVMITKVTISLLTINACIVIVLIIWLTDAAYERSAAGDVMVNLSVLQVPKKAPKGFLAIHVAVTIFLTICWVLSLGCFPVYFCYHADVDLAFQLSQQCVSDQVLEP